MKRICVFAGSNSGTNAKYKRRAEELGKLIADLGLELVYGGSSTGLMGAIANEVLAYGGKVIGVMPTGLFSREIVHTSLSQLIEVKDMHERKATMSRLSDAYIALPGGFGTYEELFEVICWAQIGLHRKPIGVLNVDGFFVPLMELIDHTINAGFVKPENRSLVVSASEPTTLLEHLQRYTESNFLAD